MLRINYSGYVELWVNNSTRIVSTVIMPTNQWCHIALVRLNGQTKLYQDGVQVGSTWNDSTDYLSGGANRPFIGTNVTFTGYLNGFVDEVQILKGHAAYTQNFTPPTRLGDRFEDASTAAGTVALLHCNGASGSTSVVDSGVLQSNWTAAGNAQVSTAQSVFGGSSLYFDGTGDYITPTADSSNFAFGTDDFTIEMLIRPTVVTGAFRMTYDSRPASINGDYPALYIDTSGVLYYFVGNANRITGPTLSADTWYHVAVSRSGTSTKMFVNGTQVGSTWTDTTNYLGAASRPRIGANGNATDSNNFAGYLEEIRISKGIARYTGAFTPPAAPHPDVPVIGLPSAASNSNRYTIVNKGTIPILSAASIGTQTIDGTTTFEIDPDVSQEFIPVNSSWSKV